MIRYLKAFVICMCVVLLSGCNDKVKDINGKNKTEFGINETAVYKNIHYTVTKVEYTDTINGESSLDDENKTYIGITFKIENKSKRDIGVMDCIIRTNKTNSELETTIIGNSDNLTNKIIGPKEEYSVSYYMEIDKDDVGEKYDCGNFVFDLSK